jgi:hypothetical protein
MGARTPNATERRGPDFVGIGVQKSATSWLADAIDQHPACWVPRKELNFFTREFPRGWDWYESHFEGRGDRVAGEFTVSTMLSPRSDALRKEKYPGRSLRHVLMPWRRAPDPVRELSRRYPDVRVLALFRDPADRAWSAYWYWHNRRVGRGRAVAPFKRMFADDGRWIRTHGCYATHLARWRAAFPDLGVFLQDDVRADAGALVAAVYRFLGVDEAFRPELEREVNVGRRPPLPPDVRAWLVDEYRDEIERFAEMIGRDLSAWLAPRAEEARVR